MGHWRGQALCLRPNSDIAKSSTKSPWRRAHRPHRVQDAGQAGINALNPFSGKIIWSTPAPIALPLCGGSTKDYTKGACVRAQSAAPASCRALCSRDLGWMAARPTMRPTGRSYGISTTAQTMAPPTASGSAGRRHRRHGSDHRRRHAVHDVRIQRCGAKPAAKGVNVSVGVLGRREVGQRSRPDKELLEADHQFGGNDVRPVCGDHDRNAGCGVVTLSSSRAAIGTIGTDMTKFLPKSGRAFPKVGHFSPTRSLMFSSLWCPLSHAHQQTHREHAARRREIDDALTRTGLMPMTPYYFISARLASVTR